MGRAVGAGEAGAVEAERDGQVLQGHFLKDLIEGPLQERRINGDDRFGPRLGLAGGERHGVRFTDAGVEETVGEVGPDLFQLVALAHGRGHHRHVRVLLHRLVDRGTGHVRVSLEPPCRSETMVRSGPTFSNTGGVWYVTGSSLACCTPWPLTVSTCSSTGPV